MPLYVPNKSADHQYYPEHPEYKSSPRYTLGSRRENEAGVLTNVTSTPDSVGPGTYVAESVTNLAKWKQESRWSFPQANRRELYDKPNERYQTYDVRSSLGAQAISTKQSLPQFKIPQETRDGRQKTGIFTTAMTQPPIKIHLPHPSF